MCKENKKKTNKQTQFKMKKQFFSCYSSAKFDAPHLNSIQHSKYKIVPNLLINNNNQNNEKNENEFGCLLSEIKIPKPIPFSLVKQVHEINYVNQFLNGTLSRKQMKRIGIEWSEACM
jgi:hypothetical protein